MKKQTKDVDFRPEKPRLDLPQSSQKPTVQLIGSLSTPGGNSLVSPPTIDVKELLDENQGVSMQERESKQDAPLFPGDPLSTKPKASKDPAVVKSVENSPQEEFVQKQKLLKSRLSFERIDELTRPQKQETTKAREIQDNALRTNLLETKQLDLPDWVPLPKLTQQEAPPVNSEIEKKNCFIETEDEIISIPLQIKTNLSTAESIEKRILSMSQETERKAISNVTEKYESAIALPMQRSGSELLSTENIRKSYSKGKLKIPVLNGVNFAAYSGEFVSIVGQSGSGKSTLLHLLGTLDNPDSGTIHFEGRRIDNLPIAKRDLLRNRSIGFIFQFYHLLPELTTLENVLSPLMIRESIWGYMTRRRQYIEQGKEILDRVGLSHRLKHRPSELSGGEMQRAAIARALVAEPKILLADEPTGNLDSSSAGEIIEILRCLNEDHQLTIIMVTHDNIIAKAADRMVRMVDGMIVEENPTTLEERLLHRIGS